MFYLEEKNRAEKETGWRLDLTLLTMVLNRYEIFKQLRDLTSLTTITLNKYKQQQWIQD